LTKTKRNPLFPSYLGKAAVLDVSQHLDNAVHRK
jgi:hypothetical protein